MSQLFVHSNPRTLEKTATFITVTVAAISAQNQSVLSGKGRFERNVGKSKN